GRELKPSGQSSRHPTPPWPILTGRNPRPDVAGRGKDVLHHPPGRADRSLGQESSGRRAGRPGGPSKERGVDDPNGSPTPSRSPGQREDPPEPTHPRLTTRTAGFPQSKRSGRYAGRGAGRRSDAPVEIFTSTGVQPAPASLIHE